MMLYEFNEETTLYYLGANNRIYEWSIEVEDNTIIIKHGIKGGAKVTNYEEIEKGKGGRSLYGQIRSRVESRINTQKLKGYKDSIQDAMQGRNNALDLPKPMLAQPWSKVKHLDLNDCYVQWKYDGNRCLITRQGDEVIAYSRKGKQIFSIGHILSDVSIPDGTILDGELYCHGIPLPTIRSWISKNQPDTLKLSYHVYDVVAPISYSWRLKMLNQFEFGDKVEVVPTIKWADLRDPSIETLMTKAQSHGYEGLILRQDGKTYEVGKRSKSLIKVKSFLDSEFVVITIYMSEKGMPMATCYLDENKTFDVVLPGSRKEKHQQFARKEFYLGKTLTVEFSQWTPDGIPFHAVAKCWRDI